MQYEAYAIKKQNSFSESRWAFENCRQFFDIQKFAMRQET